ncbi:MAG: Uncharacterized protein XD87_0046 [candidate division WS6 bacterium 36_33]|uniref:Uncharacterized protein n=1 Tax=candidate division WS6 bacterium 36_33 TaxID=1641388 RepID=A0A101GZK0_9BACT|nr:MAG: Uncharacterized protein XD87_0046 [candidate division WS6 bacterium 36_33]
MKKKGFITILLLLAIGGLIFFLARKPKEEVELDEKEDTQVEEEVTEKGEEPKEEYEYTGDTDFTEFSSDTQVLGEETEATFAIEELEDVSRDGFHQFTFTLTTGDEEEPFVTASYLSNMGVVRVDFQGISRDSTDIGYQQEREVDKEGVLKIYHNISADADQELYDIGVSRSTIFFLTSEQIEKGKWYVILQVKYPGAADVDVDLGSENFSEDDQSIVGVTAEDGATISSYSYSSGTGLLKLVWTVTSQVDNPIPSVSATYNEDDELVVTFDSLATDRVAAFGDTLTLPSSIIAEVERVGDSSVYTFTGLDEVREYKLSASLSPNQVILEIR